MADLSDVSAYLAQQAALAVYPSGTGSPSVANIKVAIFEGWPIADQLDKDVAAGAANVSVFPMQGTGKAVYQILDETYTITPAAITSTAVLAGNVITVTGSISTGEYLTLVIDDLVVCSRTGANVAAMLSALAADAVAAGYAAVATSTTLTVPFGHSLVVRQGGVAVLGKVTHRQCHSVMVTVWAPNRVARNQLSAAIDGLIKQANKVSLPDTSQATIVYSRTNVSDEQQAATIYRRDLIYDVEYATVEQFPGYVVTSTQVSIINAFDASANATALT